jgi:hypothetical protein
MVIGPDFPRHTSAASLRDLSLGRDEVVNNTGDLQVTWSLRVRSQSTPEYNYSASVRRYFADSDYGESKFS